MYEFEAPALKQIFKSEKQNITNRGIKLSFYVNTTRHQNNLNAKLSFNCVQTKSPRQSSIQTSPVEETDSETSNASFKEAAEIIKEEDAGGRYFRHVASQYRIVAKNWKGTAAFVDYEFGNGQKIPVNFFLICDERISRPCIEVWIAPQKRISQSHVNSILDFVSKISHTTK